MDALNILDAVRDPIVYSQKIGTAQGGKELNLMICMNMNINSGKSEEIFPPANCARHTCCSHLPTSCAAIINADVIYHHFMCSYSVIVAGYQPGGIDFFFGDFYNFIFSIMFSIQSACFIRLRRSMNLSMLTSPLLVGKNED